MSCAAEGSGEAEESITTVILGIMLGIAGSFGINIGNNMQAIGLTLKAAAKGSPEENAAKHRRGGFVFLVGTIVFASASIINFVAFAFAPASILAPLESLQFVSNLLFGKFVNKVSVTRRMFGGCCAVIMGTALAVVLGPSDVFQFSIPILVDFWTSKTWIAYVIIVICVAICAQATNILYTRWLEQGREPRYANKVLPITFAVSSALMGTQSVVQAKSLSEVVEQLGCGVNIFNYAYTYMAATLFLTQVAVWLYRLTAALGLYDPLFIIPLLQSNYILFATISGGIYFQEFNTMEGYQWAGFAVGCAIMFIGLYFLAPETTDDVPEASEPEEVSERAGEPAPELVARSSRLTLPMIQIHRCISRGDIEFEEDSTGGHNRFTMQSADGIALMTGMPFMNRNSGWASGRISMSRPSGRVLADSARYTSGRFPLDSTRKSNKVLLASCGVGEEDISPTSSKGTATPANAEKMNSKPEPISKTSGPGSKGRVQIQKVKRVAIKTSSDASIKLPKKGSPPRLAI